MDIHFAAHALPGPCNLLACSLELQLKAVGMSANAGKGQALHPARRKRVGKQSTKLSGEELYSPRVHAHTGRYTSAKMQICASRSSSAASSRDVTALSLAISAVRRWIIASADSSEV